jgi:hypothetical protein
MCLFADPSAIFNDISVTIVGQVSVQFVEEESLPRFDLLQLLGEPPQSADPRIQAASGSF